MKAIVFGITVGILLLMNGFSTAVPSQKTNTQTTLFDDNVPEWQVGNSWTYTMNNFTINYNVDNQIIYLNGKIDDFTWTVTNTSDSTYYLVTFTGKLTATYNVDITSFSGKLQVSGALKPTRTKFTGTLQFSKSDLQIHHFTAEIKGFSRAIIAPLTFPLPIPFKFIAESDMSDDFPLFDFPLSTDKLWNMPQLDVTIHANAGGIFGIIQTPITFETQYNWMLWAFHCHEKQSVTVPAGTFNAYRISSLFGSYFDYYYAPEVGNLIKLDAQLQYGQAAAELKSYNYP
jgi:hypothetical protein